MHTRFARHIIAATGLAVGRAGLAAAVAVTGVVAGGAAPATAAPSFPQTVAYVRGGEVYVSHGSGERRLTTGGGHARPRWSPDGRRIAYLRGGRLWVMGADGDGKRQLTTRRVGAPAWSPDGQWLAVASAGCTGGPSVYRVSAAAPKPGFQVLFPTSCQDQPLPPDTGAPRAGGSLAERLRTDDALAWSPDGRRIAFRGGDCESIFDDCLTLGTVATGAEEVLAAYGGGGQEFSGFAVVPAFRPDGARVSWTAYQQGHTAGTSRPVHVVERDLATGSVRRIGVAEDRELSYADAGRAFLTGRYRNHSYVTLLDLATGKRTPFRPGSQPSVRPSPRA
ncbi:MAG TPA: hypothetical protein VNV66_12040 [Pilimelia sp.]|nr:hypothetical protein [Pilimelia sp.]